MSEIDNVYIDIFLGISLTNNKFCASHLLNIKIISLLWYNTATCAKRSWPTQSCFFQIQMSFSNRNSCNNSVLQIHNI